MNTANDFTYEFCGNGVVRLGSTPDENSVIDIPSLVFNADRKDTLLMRRVWTIVKQGGGIQVYVNGQYVNAIALEADVEPFVTISCDAVNRSFIEYFKVYDYARNPGLVDTPSPVEKPKFLAPITTEHQATNLTEIDGSYSVSIDGHAEIKFTAPWDTVTDATGIYLFYASNNLTKEGSFDGNIWETFEQGKAYTYLRASSRFLKAGQQVAAGIYKKQPYERVLPYFGRNNPLGIRTEGRLVTTLSSDPYMAFTTGGTNIVPNTASGNNVFVYFDKFYTADKIVMYHNPSPTGQAGITSNGIRYRNTSGEFVQIPVTPTSGSGGTADNTRTWCWLTTITFDAMQFYSPGNTQHTTRDIKFYKIQD